MSKAYRYVKDSCGLCTKRHDCLGWRKIDLREVVDYGTLMSMANCPRWNPEKKEKEGEK